jgi:hypothetical protein
LAASRCCWDRRWTRWGYRPVAIGMPRKPNNTTTKHFQSYAGAAARSGWPLPSWALGRAQGCRRFASCAGLIEEALALSHLLGDIRIHVASETQIAVIEFLTGHTAEAVDRARRTVETTRRQGTLATESTALHALADFLILDDHIEPGRAAALRVFELSRALGNVDPKRTQWRCDFRNRIERGSER